MATLTIILQAVVVPACVGGALVFNGLKKNLEKKRVVAETFNQQWERDLAQSHEAIKAFRY